jgi:hypothetical protein
MINQQYCVFQKGAISRRAQEIFQLQISVHNASGYLRMSGHAIAQVFHQSAASQFGSDLKNKKRCNVLQDLQAAK